MRITLDIDDDLLAAASKRARRGKMSLGQVISALARQALHAMPDAATVFDTRPVHGFRPIARRGSIVTNELIDRLRESGEY